MDRLLRILLRTYLRRGDFTLTTSHGETFTLGDGTGTPVAVRLTSPAAEWGLLLDPELKLGEAYMDGTFVVERGTIADVLEVALGQTSELPQWARPQWLWRYVSRRLAQFNPRKRSRQNVAHHYDLDGRLYSLFLDADRQYSCAYFESPDASLDDAQLAKKRHLAAKLLLGRGKRVLDIGCGWGGLGLYLAEMTGADVTGVTLSQEQFGIANSRAAEKGLSDRARFNLQDYRDIKGPFDRIVSVGMFEHVGVVHYRAFFDTVARCLGPDGVALLHSIGQWDGPGTNNPWIRKYIFPGAYCPALSEVTPAIERSGLLTTDIEVLRLHYAETLRHWRRRFATNRDTIASLYDERFCRMFEFYLSSCELGFRAGSMAVFQIQLAHQQTAVPLTRDYIAGSDHRDELVDTYLHEHQMSGSYSPT